MADRINQPVERHSYEPPAVIYEAPLEVRVGSPLGLPGLSDPLIPGGN